jgi:hypothetical protein
MESFRYCGYERAVVFTWKRTAELYLIHITGFVIFTPEVGVLVVT